MDDDDAVAGEVHVELEAVGAERESVIEGLDRVLRPERGAAAMREHEGPVGTDLGRLGQRSNLNRPRRSPAGTM